MVPTVRCTDECRAWRQGQRQLSMFAPRVRLRRWPFEAITDAVRLRAIRTVLKLFRRTSLVMNLSSERLDQNLER